MMKVYVFLANSTKPNVEQLNSREQVIPGNVSRPCLLAALHHGYEVVLGVNRNNPAELSSDLPIKMYDQHIYRSITSIKDNLIAIRNLNSILKTKNVEVIHCNSPIGGVIGRVCGKKNHVKYIIYTAHGFHFYKGAPLINRTLFKWAEMLMAHWTDAIITINEEDYEAAKKFRLRNNGKVYKVHGVGISTSELKKISCDVNEKRSQIGIKSTDFLCISAGDLIQRKNYEVAIRAIAKTENKSIHYAICGDGKEKNKLYNLAHELGIESQIHFLGYRKDVQELMAASDLFLFTSLQEGLPRSLMEAMAIGLPVVVSNIRGNTDLIRNGRGGFLHCPDDVEGFAQSIAQICCSVDIRNKMKKENLKTIKNYDVSIVSQEMAKIYDDILPYY